MPDPPQGFWDNLLDYIQDRTVIPVIGSELVTVHEGGRFDRWLAQRLAADLELPAAELPAGFDLNDVVSLHLRRRGEREELYAQIHRMVRNAALTPPEPLRLLAGIPGFDLFVSLTFDSLLADALDAARASGGPHVQQIAYSPTTVRDLACPKAELRQPVVFHLLGRASASPDYAICDEDLLEFLHAMQDKQRQPKTLFDELRGNHLLILGCDFGDWLARFFLRAARSLELSQKRKRWDVLVGDQIAQDAGLAQFLESFSSDARVVPWTAPRFVTELARRWQAAHPAAAPGVESAAGAGGTGGRSIPTGAIFLSYASEDLEAAGRLAEGLSAAGLEVWFDKDALRMADDWARSIRRGIERCSLFLPIISRQAVSEENRRRYFWREWNDADDFARGMAPDEAFIVPVVIDDTPIDRAPLPDSFKRVQGRSLPEGNVTPDVAGLLRELVRDFHRRQRAA
ncbi:MAG TPA: toll/interleukin-1 receptor domain-containing protein [Thermoanaerobaculia bacterium]|nr:toll/interleukin-1 receptor domain-containing protein [Thermoanaerobaculia bacterium]